MQALDSRSDCSCRSILLKSAPQSGSRGNYMKKSDIPIHFKGKEALQHVIDARIKGRGASAEIHGTELPGHYSAAADAAKETALVLIVLWTLFIELKFP